MKKRRIIVLALALFAALGAAFMAKKMLGAQKQVAEPAKPQIEIVKVLVAANEIRAGQKVTESDLKWQEWPKDAVPQDYVRDDLSPEGMSEAASSTARSNFASGEPILKNKLLKAEGSGYMSAILPAGMRAVSIKISPETGAGGFILPNDRVDVVLTREKSTSRSGEKFYTETILTNVRVLAIDQNKPEKDEQSNELVAIGKTATLELTQPHAELIALAESMGEITLSLRSIQDYKTTSLEGDGPQTANGFGSGNKSESGTVKIMRYGVTSTSRSN